MLAVTLSSETLRTVAIYVACLVMSVAVHEYAHAWAAHRLGDRTPEAEGRLTLNPLAHADPVGTLALPVIAALFSLPALGWGRPVPTQPRNYSRRVSMRTGLALVAVAGPAANLIFAACTLVLAAALAAVGLLPAELRQLLHFLLSLNLLLMVFNLLPIHPLDGGKILSAVLPSRLQAVDEFLEQWGGTLIIVLIVLGARVGLLGQILYPFVRVTDLLWRLLVS